MCVLSHTVLGTMKYGTQYLFNASALVSSGIVSTPRNLPLKNVFRYKHREQTALFVLDFFLNWSIFGGIFCINDKIYWKNCWILGFLLCRYFFLLSSILRCLLGNVQRNHKVFFDGLQPLRVWPPIPVVSCHLVLEF